MTLNEAFQVAKAVGDCIDPPVIHGIFRSLNEAFPDFHFHTDDDGEIQVLDKNTFDSRTGSIYE